MADEEAPTLVVVENAAVTRTGRTGGSIDSTVLVPIGEDDNEEESVSSRTIVGSNISLKSDKQVKGGLHCHNPLYLNNTKNLAEPLPTELPQGKPWATTSRTTATTHTRRPAALHGWILIALAVAIAALCLGIALPLTLVVLHKNSSSAAGDTVDSQETDNSQQLDNSQELDNSTTTPEHISQSPVPPPSMMPALPSKEQRLQETLRQNLLSELYERMTSDSSSTEYASFQFLVQDDPQIAPPTLQRFVLAHWNSAVGGNAVLNNISECQWEGIHCDTDNIVRSIQWNNRNLTGHLPDSMLSSLTTVDFGENSLRGSIPTSWYLNGTALQYIYLQNNALTGTISTQVAQWESLRRLYLGSNQLSGSLPQELGSAVSGRANARPLGTFSIAGR